MTNRTTTRRVGNGGVCAFPTYRIENRVIVHFWEVRVFDDAPFGAVKIAESENKEGASEFVRAIASQLKKGTVSIKELKSKGHVPAEVCRSIVGEKKE